MNSKVSAVVPGYLNPPVSVIIPVNKHVPISLVISIPKCSRIRIKKHRDFIGDIKSITVSKTTDEKYYISLLVEENTKSIKLLDTAIGLDLGLKDFIVDSNAIYAILDD